MPKTRSILGALALLCCMLAHGQFWQQGEFQGKVTSADGDVEGVNVMNLTTKRATITNQEGAFRISASVNDTILFSALQYQKKQFVITAAMLQGEVRVAMDEHTNALDEVVVRPYNLVGSLDKDVAHFSGQTVTAAGLGLPNAYVKPLTQSQRKLNEATTGGGIVPLNPLINAITGRTKMLKNRVKIDETYARTQRVHEMYADSLFVKHLGIPVEKIPDFMYFCEVDSTFQHIVDTHDQLRIWDFLRQKSTDYRTNNDMD